MNVAETFRSSLTALLANKVRSFLTMLGVIIGVFAVIVLISLGKGIQNYISDQFEAFGSNLIFIAPGKAGFTGDPALSFSNNKLDEKHVKLIETYASDLIVGVAPSMRTGKTAQYKTKSYFAAITGTTANVEELMDYHAATGRFITDQDVKTKNRVAVLGPVVAQELFGDSNPIGKKIKLGENSYLVIGVAEEKSQDFDQAIVVPYTAVKDTFGIKNFSDMVVKTKSPDTIADAMRQVQQALLRDLKEDDFTVMSQTDILSSIQSILGIFTLGVGSIAAISLIVGGIGIMNIMLVSVTERIKEIGLRKALGATQFNIGLQFLMESTMLSVLGGSIGIALGYAGALIARSFIRTEVPWWAVALAFGFSVAVGIGFGTYPAIKASKKDPIEALRYE